MPSATIATIGVLVVAFSVVLTATEDECGRRFDEQSSQGSLGGSDVSKSAGATDRSSTLPLTVQNIRMEAPDSFVDSPSAVLRFDLFNAGVTPLTAITLEISVLEKSSDDRQSGRPIVHPFRIRGDLVLDPGYTVNFGMLLRNLSSDCVCIAKVDVISVRALLQ